MRKHNVIHKTGIRHIGSISTRWHFAFGLRCHSNETRPPIANPPNNAQPRGTPTTPPSYIWVPAVVWADTQTDRRAWFDQYTFRVVYDSYAKCNYLVTEPRPQVTRTENFMKSEHVVWDMRTNKQTYKHADRNSSQFGLLPGHSSLITPEALYDVNCWVPIFSFAIYTVHHMCAFSVSRISVLYAD